MPNVYGNEIVEKRNILNEIRQKNMTLQQLRFFSIYLAKINARDLSTRVVRFPLSDFQKIMGIGRMNIQHFKEAADSLLLNAVHIPNAKGGMDAFTLFRKCSLFQDKKGEWVVEINANDEALPLMFDFKSHYFTYELWNALRLKSTNQLRMYEILKQYERIGKREIAVSELRVLLGIEPKEYTVWNNFKVKVLDSCQEALAKHTDICYTYEKGESGVGGKWLSIIFHITKNKNYVDPLSLKDFIDVQQVRSDALTEPQHNVFDVGNISTRPDPIPPQNQQKNRIESNAPTSSEITGKFCKDFTEKQIFLLSKVLTPKVAPDMKKPEKLKEKLDSIYSEIQLRYESIKNPIAMMLKFINNIPDYVEPPAKPDEHFCDLDHFEEDYEIFINRF